MRPVQTAGPANGVFRTIPTEYELKGIDMLLARLTLLLCLLFAIGDLRAEDAPRAMREDLC